MARNGNARSPRDRSGGGFLLGLFAGLLLGLGWLALDVLAVELLARTADWLIAALLG
jgi:hypothetical protein